MEDFFLKYKEYKGKLSFNYRGYPLHKIISVELASIIYGKKVFNYWDITRFFSSRDVELPVGQEKPFFLYSMGGYGRDDYYSLLNYVREQVPGPLIDLNHNKKRIKVNLINIIKAIRFVFSRVDGISFKDKILISSFFSYLMNYIDTLEKKRVDMPEAYIAFCSSHMDEGVLDTFFKNKNIRTYTLQHGLYFICDNKNIDMIAYENIISDRLLCWGEYTKNEFSRYGVPREQMLVAGYPNETKKLGKRTLQGKPCILVLLSRYTFHANNMKMLKLLSSLKLQDPEIKIDVKMHPSLQINDYNEIFEKYGFSLCASGTIKSLLESDKYHMTISYNSTAYYDSYMNNCASLRYIDEDADDSINVMDDGFDDELSLMTKISKVKSEICTEDFWVEVESRLKYITGYNINNYKISITNTLNNKH
ncbi:MULTISPECIES: hypothetical protein [unclassified Brenneria]|uniref:hypothetical protein n=1 Tax=unclassified Brenneria TaxID=2634434 RepID=UPI001554A1E6|nr:hypothetical protein [Brenneria sp. hezel4-2-4]MEE3650974.1 hypothetical protein [Brenneria sp. HEZEL_4_2_4]NPD00929.1 hypothetical protein [Brenneria sp. hezel4-2-4]